MKSNKSEISDIAYLPINAPSHVFPFVGFFQELESRGMDLDFYGPKGILNGALKSIGKNHFVFEELDNKEEAGKTGILESIFKGFLETVPAIEALWEERKKKPKVILADMFAPFANYLAKKHQIPLIILYGSYLIEDLKPFVQENDPQGMLAPIDESLNSLKNDVREKCGVTINIFPDILTHGDYNISCLPKFIGDSIAPSKDREGYEYVGPAFRDESKLDSFDIDPGFLQNNDIIYVSLGTAPPNKLGFTFYEDIIKAFGNTDHKVLISATMGKAKELSEKGVPKNIILKSWVPQMKVLDHCKLFISHVGAGSMMEAIYKGVPVMAVPNFADQPVNAKVLESLNLGKWLKDKTTEGVKKLTEEILADKEIKANCQKHRESINPQKSRERFVQIIQSHIN